MTAGIDLIEPDWIGAPARVRAFATGRSGGVSQSPFDDGSADGGGGLNLGANAGDAPDAVLQNRLLLTRKCPSEPVWLQQVHGNKVIDAARAQKYYERGTVTKSATRRGTPPAARHAGPPVAAAR